MLNARTLKLSAREKLPGDHKKLALIHTAAALGVSLVLTLLQHYLNQQIGTTGGLSGLGARAVLETVQMVLQYAVNIALPFWEIGFLYAALRMARGQSAGVPNLLEGFRRFGPVLRLYLIQGMLYFGVAMACLYAGSFIFTMTPWALPLMEKITPMVTEGATLEEMQSLLLEMPMEEMLNLFLPYFIIAGILFAVLAVFLFYRFRVAEFLIMDRPGTGALAALIGSSRMTKGRRMKLFRLDLSFWWFYVLLGISLAVSYADLLLPASGDMAWLICYAVSLVIQLVVYWQFYGYVKTTHATAYEVLLQQPLEQPKPQPAPKNLPWDDYNSQE